MTLIDLKRKENEDVVAIDATVTLFVNKQLLDSPNFTPEFFETLNLWCSDMTLHSAGNLEGKLLGAFKWPQ